MLKYSFVYLVMKRNELGDTPPINNDMIEQQPHICGDCYRPQVFLPLPGSKCTLFLEVHKIP